MSDENMEAVVQEAESQGWVEKEKFKGKEEDWVDAETFVKRGREIMPILRKNNESLLKDLSATKAQLAEFKKAAEEFKQFQKEASERKVNELKATIQALKADRAQAITDGDGDKVNAIDDAIDDIKEQQQAVKTEPKVAEEQNAPITLDPILTEWLGENEWFGKDKKLTSYANEMGAELRQQYPHLTGKAFLNKLSEALEEELPSKFKKVKPGNPVESGSGRGRTVSSKKSYNDLPDDAKKACDRYVKQGLIKSREEYVAEYDWS